MVREYYYTRLATAIIVQKEYNFLGWWWRMEVYTPIFSSSSSIDDDDDDNDCDAKPSRHRILSNILYVVFFYIPPDTQKL